MAPAEDPALPLVHVTFGQSAAGSLIAALRTLGREEPVLPLLDDLSFGPIDADDYAPRARWCCDELGFDAAWDLCDRVDAFWRRISLPTHIVVWMSSRYVSEYCGLLEVLRRVKDTPISVIDVADTEFVGRDGTRDAAISTAFACVGDRQIVRQRLIDRAVPVSTSARDVYRAEWQTARNENGAFRVLTPTGLFSSPMTYFDEALLGHVTSKWRQCGRVVGDAVSASAAGAFRQMSNDRVMFCRLLGLIDEGVIEGRTDTELWSLRESWVRRSGP